MGIMLLIAGFIGIIGGLFMIAAAPASWVMGVLLLVIGLVFFGFALGSKEETKEESEKPVISITTEDEKDN
jgi:uncharacterized membrane protein YfcA